MRTFERLREMVEGELAHVRPRQHVLSAMSRAIPLQIGGSLRAKLLSLRGVSVGEGTLLLDTPRVRGDRADSLANLRIGEHCVIDVGCNFELGDTLTIGDRVTIGPQCLIITTTHELGPREHRAGPVVRRSVVIENGAWLGARSIVLPGVTIGEGAIVDPGSVVTKDVVAHTRVRGMPARQVEQLTP